VSEQPDSRTPEQIERDWYENVYRGRGDSMRQLTPRALIMGALLGCVMSLTNIYIGLKTGWALGVAITACILSFSIWRTLRTTLPFLVRSDFTILENNCMQSTATAAGYSVGNTMVTAIAAMLMLTNHQMDFWVLLAWNILLAVLGVVMAVPLKRQMVNVEQLAFPDGTAAAETLRSLHATGGSALPKARALGIAGAAGALVAWMRDATFRFMPWNLPADLPFGRFTAGGIPLAQLTLKWDMGLVMMAAGAIAGFRVGWSMLLGAVINYAVLAPIMIHRGDIVPTLAGGPIGFRDITRWSLWIGASMMVVSSFVALAFHGGAIGRALAGVRSAFSRRPARADDPLAAIEVPASWVLIGFVTAGAGVVWMLHHLWHVHWWMGVLAVLLTWVLSVVACRATGETNTTPTGALGKVTQLTYGVIAPSNMTTNLMTASVTANAAGCAADLLTDLKSGYLLGANPRQQFIAQLAGILPGAIVVGLAWNILVPDASALGGDRFPAPAAQVWKGVAELLSHGLGMLPVSARWGALAGGLTGLVLSLAERMFPRARRFIPSPIGLGLAFVMQGFNAISMFAGGLAVWLLERARPQLAERYATAVASGVIAGESLMAIVIIVMQNVWPGWVRP
jgi:putative OPT family oligopeptide transporter